MSVTTVYLDTETYSELNLKTAGLDRYRRHPSTEVMIVTWRFVDGPFMTPDTRCADLTREPFPDELCEAAIDDSVIFTAHNAQFDRAMFQIATRIDVPIERWRCTMAQAYAHSLPGSLAGLGLAVGLPFNQRKLAVSSELIDLFCKPNSRTGKRNLPEDSPVEWIQFLEYATMDTMSMIEAHRRMPTHNYVGEHLELWFADQEINERGFRIDRPMAQMAEVIAERNMGRLNAQVSELTAGTATKATQRERVLRHLVGEDGLLLVNLKADELKKLLRDPTLPDSARELIKLRLESSMTSKSKYSTALRLAGPDDRIRYAFQFSSASTGRHAGRGFQPHNMNRPTLDTDHVLNEIVPAIKGGYLDAVVENTNEALANALRSLIIASEGCELVVADWSNIEGRVLAWLANEWWKLNSYRDYDTFLVGDTGDYSYDEKGKPRRKGPDSYVALYSQSMKVPVAEVDGKKRQMGKGMDLSMGFGGGVGAFVNVAATYKLDLIELSDAVSALVAEGQIEQAIWDRAERNWERALIRGEDHELDYKVYCSCDALKQIYRQASPNIQQLWWDLENVCKNATMNPGTVFYAGRCTIWRNGAWLIIQLPSGRRLLYAQPRVKSYAEVVEDENGEEDVKVRLALTYMGAKNQQWRRERTYGGKLAENITQAVANDFLRATLVECRRRGWRVNLHVHDEVVLDMPKGTVSLQDLVDLVTRELPWAKGMPLAAAGFVGDRYKKDD